MFARFGNVLYWLGCLLAALCLVLGWIAYPGVDTTGIEAARKSGLNDASIVQQRMNASPKTAQQFETAAKAGYSHTEILDHLLEANRSRLADWPDLQHNPMLVMAAAAALLAWIVGRALRYVLAGT